MTFVLLGRRNAGWKIRAWTWTGVKPHRAKWLQCRSLSRVPCTVHDCGREPATTGLP